ncbi:hypothetical protein BD410DRAFT_810397 [Rickenella mellea]|uniref:Uncharacterized protein n=1 Tax=Rickenella mellea TaxID=50990 RepID=A0A4Y7PE98_9AGAM|nr:hypothetical protein BD410DRAFT_810397 [Rickenella mellea]
MVAASANDISHLAFQLNVDLLQPFPSTLNPSSCPNPYPAQDKIDDLRLKGQQDSVKSFEVYGLTFWSAAPFLRPFRTIVTATKPEFGRTMDVWSSLHSMICTEVFQVSGAAPQYTASLHQLFFVAKLWAAKRRDVSHKIEDRVAALYFRKDENGLEEHPLSRRWLLDADWILLVIPRLGTHPPFPLCNYLASSFPCNPNRLTPFGSSSCCNREPSDSVEIATHPLHLHTFFGISSNPSASLILQDESPLTWHGPPSFSTLVFRRMKARSNQRQQMEMPYPHHGEVSDPKIPLEPPSLGSQIRPPTFPITDHSVRWSIWARNWSNDLRLAHHATKKQNITQSHVINKREETIERIAGEEGAVIEAEREYQLKRLPKASIHRTSLMLVTSSIQTCGIWPRRETDSYFDSAPNGFGSLNLYIYDLFRSGLSQDFLLSRQFCLPMTPVQQSICKKNLTKDQKFGRLNAT